LVIKKPLLKITGVFKAPFPTIVLITPPGKFIYDSIMLLLFCLSAWGILASVSITTFIMAINPIATRHWRHMTPGVYLVLLSQAAAYIFLLSFGVTTADLTFIFGPLLLGAGALLCVMFMKRSEIGKVADSEKAS
jgi:hypothetical protein